VDVYNRFNTYQGNVQSALLQEVKGHLATSYPQTTLRGDGQVVVVAFNTLMIEVVPVFNYDSLGRWIMPDTNNGGRWRLVLPFAEGSKLDDADGISAGNTRRLVQMMKAWRDHCSVPLKSFVIELLVVDFMYGYRHREQTFFYYDWFVRDFFEYLLGRSNGFVVAPNSGDTVPLGDAWKSKAIAALNNAREACEDEYLDYTTLAGDNWRKIFGDRIPVSVV
jgi:hypothetical protein